MSASTTIIESNIQDIQYTADEAITSWLVCYCNYICIPPIHILIYIKKHIHCISLHIINQSTSGSQIFFMQLGFLCYEVGFVNNVWAPSIILKNIEDTFVV